METVSNQRRLESLASQPEYPQNRFLVEGFTFEQLYHEMRAVRSRIAERLDPSTPLCLCTTDKRRVAAALLAALGGGPPLLIPYALTTETLNEARQSLHYDHALIEEGVDLPSGVTAIPWPDISDTTNAKTLQDNISWDSPWIYLFTGGSTGTPQIWSKTPRNLLMEAVYLAETFNIRKEDVILATVPAYHIYGLLYAILLPLVSGASVCAQTPSYPNEIGQSLAAARATVLVSIPAHYRAMKETPIIDHCVRTAFSSAGALAESDDMDFYRSTGIAINEIYGSTETGGIARRNRNMGRPTLHPFECADVKIEDQHLRVRSDFLSQELDKADDGFFMTADRAAWAEPAGFVILGRSDGIVKVGGKRVDLAKTRETLMGVEGVRDAYVFSISVQSGRQNEIVALVEGRVTADRIMEAANQSLPSYARPRSVRVTDQMPLSSTGKYNRDAIRKMFTS